MERILSFVGMCLFFFRFIMSAFYIGLMAVLAVILWKFAGEIYALLSLQKIAEMPKIDLIIKVLELVDMTMVAQLVLVVAFAGYSLFVTAGHFEGSTIKKPDWLDHVNTYNLKLKLAFAIISISGVHTLKTFLQGGSTIEMIIVASIHLIFVLSAVGIAYAEKLTHSNH